ncbi:NAD(P)-dependent oxidoreductase [Zwartia sp.]|uniref:NAD(P)-dependent oxidoreductase n=1 Tax=Zwartia sp. TaxID=2978004 RepID=UPI00271D690C|nr:NAD(P)-dependent oxidoreductase [Zwartia sp.]MDO9024126.1 NAD(P)-dependent oxidoreductase [Zwartia sp.]
MNNKLVFLTNPIHPTVHAELESFARVSVAPSTLDEDLISGAEQASVIIVRHPLPPALFENAKNLVGVVRHGAGVDMIPLEVASQHHIAVANAPGANARTVAEFAVGQMLALAHKSAAINARMRNQGWVAARALADQGFDLAGKVVGLVGTGAIGQAVAKMCHHGFGMDVIGYRPSGPPALDIIKPATLAQIFSEADFIVLACPLNEHTRGLVSRSLLKSMKSTAYLVNVARGAVIDQDALVETLVAGEIAGAALDVFTLQPLPAQSPLYGMENVLLSPHMAGITDDSLRAVGTSVISQVRQLLRGELPDHLVNRQITTAIEQRLSNLTGS